MANAGQYDVFIFRLAEFPHCMFALATPDEWSDAACSRSQSSESTLLMDFCSIPEIEIWGTTDTIVINTVFPGVHTSTLNKLYTTEDLHKLTRSNSKFQ